MATITGAGEGKTPRVGALVSVVESAVMGVEGSVAVWVVAALCVVVPRALLVPTTVVWIVQFGMSIVGGVIVVLWIVWRHSWPPQSLFMSPSLFHSWVERSCPLCWLMLGIEVGSFILVAMWGDVRFSLKNYAANGASPVLILFLCPVCEELVFRVLIPMRFSRRQCSATLACIVSATLFSLIHLLNIDSASVTYIFWQMVKAFVHGVALFCVQHTHKAIAQSTILHSLNNLVWGFLPLTTALTLKLCLIFSVSELLTIYVSYLHYSRHKQN
ncbi:hypothetical protein Pelo_7492 [Pelomyxa schiedti]|nr:hypothetical protein Pelo_7492 [Pelomyxa schiedti]